LKAYFLPGPPMDWKESKPLKKESKFKKGKIKNYIHR